MKYFLLLSLVGLCGATPITFKISGSDSGSLDGVAFTKTAFTITAVSDTNSIGHDLNLGDYYDTMNVSIDIQGVGTYAFTYLVGAPSRLWYKFPDFRFFPIWGLDPIIEGAVNTVWNGTTSLGPKSGDGFIDYFLITCAGCTRVTTTGGVLVLDSASYFNFNQTGSLTFQAIVGDASSVPEPSTGILSAFGLLSVVAYVRRRASAGCK